MAHIGFAAPSIKHLIATELRCSPYHYFHHGGLNSHMPGACGLHGGMQEKTKFANLGVSVMDNKNRRIKLSDTVVGFKSIFCDMNKYHGVFCFS